ncbi:hypothetical protein [Ruminococcus sp.]|uniref:hypothetical protein n=1 Tax=Ruminococcus sp. TaxID=41978 RepID=UPI0025DCCD9F|nr:hypothetical protein [Ruminococcus sp.]
MSKRFSKLKITLGGIYSKFADEGFCRDYQLDVRFEKGFACTLCGGSECRRIPHLQYKIILMRYNLDRIQDIRHNAHE